MLFAAKVLLIAGGILLIFDAVLISIGNPFERPLPHPITLIILGVGLVLFAFSSRAFRKRSH